MNLKHLDYFCQLAMVGYVTRAANEIGIAQPALSFNAKVRTECWSKVD